MSPAGCGVSIAVGDGVLTAGDGVISGGDGSPVGVSLSILKGDTSPAALKRGFLVDFDKKPFCPVAAVYDRRTKVDRALRARFGWPIGRHRAERAVHLRLPAVRDRYNPLSDPGGGRVKSLMEFRQLLTLHS